MAKLRTKIPAIEVCERSKEPPTEKKPGVFLRIAAVGIKRLRGKRLYSAIEYSGGPTIVACDNRPLSGTIPGVIDALHEVTGWDNEAERNADLRKLRELICKFVADEMKPEEPTHVD